MKIIIINRLTQNDKQTTGELLVIEEGASTPYFKSKTLELPWKDNEKCVSCIPAGGYEGVQRTSEKYGKHLHITNVPNRSYILIHPANFVRQLKGCIAPGKALIDIDGNGYKDVTSSRDTMAVIVNHMPNKFKVIINDPV